MNINLNNRVIVPFLANLDNLNINQVKCQNFSSSISKAKSYSLKVASDWCKKRKYSVLLFIYLFSSNKKG